MIEAVSSGLVSPKRATVGAADVPRALLAPRGVFARVEDVPAYGWPLVLLLAAVTLIGYATVETGLIDREVERQTRQKIAALEKEQLDAVERSALSTMIEEKRKEGEFLRLMTRMQAVVVRPIAALASVLLISALFYGVVALTGRKPEWHTLLTICVFASFVDVVGLILRLAFMLRFHTLEADTSLALLTRVMNVEGGGTGMVALSGLLSAVDPFRIWFWLLMIIGLSATSQLRGWKCWLTCTLFWLIAAGARAGLAVASAGSVARG